MVRRAIYLGTIAASVIAAACTLAFPLDRFQGGTREDASASDAEADVDAARVPGCPLALPPSRPEEDDPSTDDLLIVFAVRTTGARDGGLTAGRGYDLDGYCTCANEDPPSCLGARTTCDYEGGADNQGATLFRQLQDFSTFESPFSPARFERYVDNGQQTLLIVVSKYNGQANDRQVDVGLFGADGRMPDGGNPRDQVPPNWDGNDIWSTMRETVEPGTGRPRSLDIDAYVSGGTLVTRIRADADAAFSPNVPLIGPLNEGILTGRIVREGSLWHLRSGFVTGRWRLSSFLTALAAAHDPSDQTQFLCGENFTYQVLKKQICLYADIAATAALDGKDQPCDAISVGLDFEASQAQRGQLGIDPTPEAGCGADYFDSCGK